MKDQPRTILVTGAAGFIGGHVARHLAEDGWQVSALVRDTHGPSVVPWPHPNLQRIPGDICLPATLETACAGIGVVFHAAADTYLQDQEQAWRTNVEGTKFAYQAAKQAHVRRFIFTSTFDVYLGLDVYEDEDTPLHPFGDVYADGKIAAEAFLLSQAPPPEVVILRLPPVYGPGSREWTVNLLRDAQANRLFLPAGGRAPFPYLYITNLADAVVAVAAAPHAHGIYNVLDGRITYADYWRFFAQLAGRPTRPIPYWLLYAVASGVEFFSRLAGKWTVLSRRRVRAVFGGGRRGFPSADRFQRDFGWTPRVDLAAGLGHSETWLRQNGFING